MTGFGRWAGVAAACAGLVLASGPAAAAPTWTAYQTRPNETWYYDAGSVNRSGGVVSVDIKMVSSVDYVLKSVEPVRVAKFTAVFDCNRRTGHLIHLTAVDKDGKVVLDGRAGPTEETSVGEKSLVAVVEHLVCDVAPPPVGLKPNIAADVIAKAQWLVTATGSAGGAEYSVDITSAKELKPGIVGALVREYGNNARVSPSGKPYNTAYYMDFFGCDTDKLIIFGADYYDISNSLVDSQNYDHKEAQIDLLDGSVAESEKRAACRVVKETAAAPAPAAADDTVYSSGTGWLEAKGYVITADHVVRDASSLVLVQDGKPVGKAEIVAEDPANDVAVLRPTFTDGAHPAIGLSDGPASLGEAIFTLGYPAPDAMGLAIKTTSGEVSALSGNDLASHRTDDVRFMQISAPVQSGNSGGPVLGPDGRAVGMVISKVEKTSDDDVAQNVNYALKIGYVKGLLSDLPALTRVREVEGAPSRVGLISALRGAVFLILVASPPAR